MKKSIDRVYDHAREKYHDMCGTQFEQVSNAAEASAFAELVACRIVIPTDEVYYVQPMDADRRFLGAFDVRWW